MANPQHFNFVSLKCSYSVISTYWLNRERKLRNIKQEVNNRIRSDYFERTMKDSNMRRENRKQNKREGKKRANEYRKDPRRTLSQIPRTTLSGYITCQSTVLRTRELTYRGSLKPTIKSGEWVRSQLNGRLRQLRPGQPLILWTATLSDNNIPT